MSIASAVFLSYYPLKQGLKPGCILLKLELESKFLSYYPLKQGLKHHYLPGTNFIQIDFYPTIH